MSAPDGIRDARLGAIAARFEIGAPVRAIAPLGRGLINATFRVETARGGYVLQRINGHVFPHPERIMANLRNLQALIRADDGAGPRIPGIILTRDGDAFTRDQAGGVWRMLELVPDARSLERIDTADQAREVGRILGGFHRAATDLPLARFQVSLPGFHDTAAYLRRLRTLTLNRPPPESDAPTRRLLERVEAHQHLAHLLEDACRAGDIARRITHGDPKLDNILFTADGARALALVDLDTVQPGLIQHDLGDCLRSCCNRSGEGALDPASTRFDAEICEWMLEGYAELMAERMRPEDVAAVYDAMRIIPFELGIRFLTDHLDGDRYFRVDYPGQNRLKAEIQLALVSDIERQEDRLRGTIDRIFGTGRAGRVGAPPESGHSAR